MSKKTVSLTLTVDADTDEEAWEEFKNAYDAGDFDSDSIEIYDEEDDDEEE